MRLQLTPQRNLLTLISFNSRPEKNKLEQNNVPRSLPRVFGVVGSPLSMAICCDRSIAVDHFLFFYWSMMENCLLAFMSNIVIGLMGR